MTSTSQVQSNTHVAISRLSKSFASRDSETSKQGIIFKDLTLTINGGELTTIFGPNGSGKTTLLNLLAGLTQPDGGSISIGGEKPSPGMASYLFQNFKDSLFPWRTVKGNLLFPLECQISDEKERLERLQKFIHEFQFNIPLQSKVYELSIGQQQMVSLARTLITHPRFILMDEPFSALDFRVRHYMQERLLTYWKEYGATILLISHEIDDAIYLGQRVILFPPRPVTAVRELPIPLPLPRRREMLYTQEYFQLRSEALRFFDEKLNLN
jgi:NitT/TauT family transport system ATP-binding protein